MLSKKILRICAAGTLLIMNVAATAQSRTAWELGIGYESTSGKYGTTAETEIKSVPLSLAYHADSWSWRVDIPYIEAAGPIEVVPGFGKVRENAASPQLRTAEGAGDVLASASYQFLTRMGLGGAWSAKVKFGTADSSAGLGTGENDYMVQLDLFETRDRWTVFSTVGYAFIGDTAELPLEDVRYGTVGTDVQAGAASRIGIAYDYRDKMTDLGSEKREASIFYAMRIGGAGKLKAYVMKGFSPGGPDRGIGGSISYSF